MDITQFDLAADAESGFDLVLLNPRTGVKTDVVITVIGSDSKSYRKARSTEQRRAILDAKATGEEVDVDLVNARIYAKCVTGWTGMFDGENEIVFTPEKALEILTNLPWICDQVGEAVEKRVNFMKKSEAN